MIRLIVAAALTFVVTAAVAQQGTPDPAKLEKCKQLAKQRGFNSGMENKGSNPMRSFVIACMQGKQS